MHQIQMSLLLAASLSGLLASLEGLCNPTSTSTQSTKASQPAFGGLRNGGLDLDLGTVPETSFSTFSFLFLITKVPREKQNDHIRDVHYVSLARLESGRPDPQLSTLLKLCCALGITIN
jgi:hypothetical protein